MNKAIFKFRLKNTLISLLYLLIVFIFAFISDKIYEIFTFILTYTIIRYEFTKMIHGSDFTKSSYKGIVYCRLITFAIQIISIIFIINIDISKYINLILAFILGIINFLGKDYLEYKLNKVVFYKGMTVEEFANHFPIGVFIVRVEGHLTCVIDNNIMDIWNCKDEIVDLVWEVK